MNKNVLRRKSLYFLNKIKYLGMRKLYYLTLNSGKLLIEILTNWWLIKRQKQQPILFNTKIGRILIKYFDGDAGHNIEKNKGFIGFGLIHYALIRNCRPKRILCIGSRKGYIPAILGLACKDNSFGNIDFIDAGYGRERPKEHWTGIGFWKHADSKNYFNKLKLQEIISIYICRSSDFALKYPKRKYQYIYIDADHSYEGVKTDYHLFWSRLEQGGFMIFHDIVARGFMDKGRFGVWKFWAELDNKNKIEFPFPSNSGLGIIQKSKIIKSKKHS